MRKTKQVIELKGTFHSLEDAYIQVRNEIVSTDVLQDHPDMDKYFHAEELLSKLHGKGILSNKIEAIIEYNSALNKLYKFTVDEI